MLLYVVAFKVMLKREKRIRRDEFKGMGKGMGFEEVVPTLKGFVKLIW
jgi:hypothetical protein